MIRRILTGVVAAAWMVFLIPTFSSAETVEVLGVKFPRETVIEGKTLKLNGVSWLKKFGVVKVYAVGLYLENPTHDAETVISSQQIKYMRTQYLTSKATADKLQEGFVEMITTANPAALVEAHKADINTYASWLDKDMAPGLTSESIYVPGKGLTLIYQDQVKGTIPGDAFAQMYYQYNVGEKADKKIREGLLGLEK
ncbi:chalcone isomerase family protein [Desulfosarcina sp. OttesenSCG-928-A07]|nr:chalcone isomerase family protein [Desulfosarcina sp. OttesenSCG-928-A07]